MSEEPISVPLDHGIELSLQPTAIGCYVLCYGGPNKERMRGAAMVGGWSDWLALAVAILERTDWQYVNAQGERIWMESHFTPTDEELGR